MKNSQFSAGKNSSSKLQTNKTNSNHVTFLRTYKVFYLGYAVLDRRYTLPMLPWVIAEIRRHGSRNLEEVFLEVTEKSLKAVNCESKNLVFEHILNSISKFAQYKYDSSCFTYLTREVANGPCAYHVFQVDDENTILELFMAIREVSKEMTGIQSQGPGGNDSLSSLNSSILSCRQFEVLYIGKIKVSGKRVSSTFIDDAVEKFRLYESEKTKNLKFTKNQHSESLNNISRISANVDSLKQSLRVSVSNESTISSLTLKESGSHDSDVFQSLDSSDTESSIQSLSNVNQKEIYRSHSNPPSVTFSEGLNIDEHQSMQMKCSLKLHEPSKLFPSSLITHTQSLSAPSSCSDIACDHGNQDLSNLSKGRTRTFSGDTSPRKQISLPTYLTQKENIYGAVRPRSYTSPVSSDNNEKNRTMIFIIGQTEIYLIGMDKKQIILTKAFSDISHCSQGVKYVNHFGFISREATVTGNFGYAGYIFCCQTEKVVDEIMASLKQAFTQAHNNYCNLKNIHVPKFIVCDTCPMHWFHLLCLDLEGLNAEETHVFILEKLSSLPDRYKEDIMTKFQNSDFHGLQEQNEILMMLLREYSEQRQIHHSHTLQTSFKGKSDSYPLKEKEKYSKLDFFREKARKSLSNSFETFCKFAGREESKEIHCTSNNSSKKNEEFITQNFHKDPDTHSYREGSYSGDVNSNGVSPVSRKRSSTFSSPREKITLNKLSAMETPRKLPIINMFIKSDDHYTSSDVKSTPKGSWRQAIFHKVQTPIDKQHYERDGSFEDQSEPKKKRTKQELRALWRKAIIEQILLIRMEKENMKLRVGQDAASLKRMKLSYEEVTPCLKSTTSKWEKILSESTHDMNVEKSMLVEMVKLGVPRHKRCDIWQFLADYNTYWNNSSSSEAELSVPYDYLLKQLTSHQHSILIDIGRTFPSHPYFSQSLGCGQLSLFNILKAYSLLDKEVGYCQGLSFIAGILLLHMPEEQAFLLLKYLMFDLGLRCQYKTDMVAFQIQMYQLSRLLHDNFRDIYDHFEKFDITPTLYAAPWFLTLFASQFPIGFVSRLFDLIFLNGVDVVFKVALLLVGNYKNEILACCNFESVMDFLKNALPSISVIQMEIIFNQVFTFNIHEQLHAYEVEYQVLLEEMIHSPSKNCVDLKELQDKNVKLEEQNADLMQQLEVAHSQIHKLEVNICELQSSVQTLRSQKTGLEDELESLSHSWRILQARLERLEHGETAIPALSTVYAGTERDEDKQFRNFMYQLSHQKQSSEHNE